MSVAPAELYEGPVAMQAAAVVQATLVSDAFPESDAGAELSDQTRPPSIDSNVVAFAPPMS